VIIKAAAGGGGKGMRIAHNDIRLVSSLMTAQAEAEANFGNSNVYIEKYIERPRHIEIQILADKHGNIVHLGERDCSIQRRHQKLLEESPSTAVDQKLRKRLGDWGRND
jgi:acetyl-CoA carboxylase biotin carboxylase subunit